LQQVDFCVRAFLAEGAKGGVCKNYIRGDAGFLGECHAQGREPLVAVNAKRAEAGLYLLRGDADNYQITWTLKSRHIDGLAMDVLPVDGRGNPTWDLSHYRQQFTAISKCARDAGLECGADWPAPKTDWPHYEIKEG
jgi:hypothetical protein